MKKTRKNNVKVFLICVCLNSDCFKLSLSSPSLHNGYQISFSLGALQRLKITLTQISKIKDQPTISGGQFMIWLCSKSIVFVDCMGCSGCMGCWLSTCKGIIVGFGKEEVWKEALISTLNCATIPCLTNNNPLNRGCSLILREWQQPYVFLTPCWAIGLTGWSVVYDVCGYWGRLKGVPFAGADLNYIITKCSKVDISSKCGT